MVPIRARHFLHPIRTVRSAYIRGQQLVYRFLAERAFSQVRRSQRSTCWCGGSLQAFNGPKSYAMCRDCGCYVNQRPPLEGEMLKFYSKQMYWGAISKYRGWPTLEGRAEMYRSDGRLDYWLQLVSRYGPPRGRVIEVGCAPGVLLAKLCEMKYECLGVEPDPQVAHWIKAQVGIEVVSGFFPGADLPPCELFLAFDVLEHVLSPNEFLKEVGRLLVPQGIAIIQTPIERKDLQNPFKERIEVFHDVDHTFIFTDESIRRMAEPAGLEITGEENGWMLGHEVVVLRKP